MTSLESPKENLNNNSGLMSLEIESSRLKNKVKLSALKTETLKGKFRLVRNSGDYKIYSYILEKGGLPAAVRAKAVIKNLATSQEKKDILITDIDGNKYNESTNFRDGKKVYVKIPTKKSKVDPKRAEIKPQQNKPKEVSNKKVETKQKTEIQQPKQPKIGVLEYKNLSSNGEYEIYSCYIGSSSKTFWNILNETGKQIKLKTVSGIKITNSNGKKILGPFKNEKIYIWVPKYDIENDVKIIDGMKCKGGEYFGIDVSRFNDQINLASFQSWNSDRWSSKDKNKRGVSFIYIRAGDGHPNAKSGKDKESLTNWTNFVKEHNNDKKVKDQHEQIATGFYWTLTNKKDAITQADDFLKIYNSYKEAPGGEKLIPMIDLETDRRNEIKKSHKNKKGKTVVDERYSPKEFRENTLKWLQYVEKKTGVTPGIYVGAQPYGNYIMNDSRFKKYPIRLTAYPDNDKIGREVGTAWRIDFKQGTVKVGNKNNFSTVKPEMYQSSQEGTVPGTAAKNREKDKKTYYDTDMDHTKDITKLFSKNNKSK